MAFVIPTLAAVGTALGASSATAVAVGATAVSTAVSVAGAAVAGVQSYSQAQTQKKIAKSQAQIAEENAKRSRFRSQVEQQDQDMLARAVIGDLASSQAASGLNFGSGSFSMRRKAANVLARKDALNIRQGGELEAQNYTQQALDSRFEAKQAQTSSLFSLVETGLNTGSSLIGGASKINKIKAAGLRQNAGMLT